MFERFTDRARKIMSLANMESQRMSHDHIDAAHILLGMAKEESGVGANVLKNLGVDLRTLRVAVEKHLPFGPAAVTMGKLPNSEMAKKVIEEAILASRGLGHNYVGTEHLLLGLCAVEGTVARTVLDELGVSVDKAKAETLVLIGSADSETREALAFVVKAAPWAVEEQFWKGLAARIELLEQEVRVLKELKEPPHA